MDIGTILLLLFVFMWFMIFLNALKKRNNASTETETSKKEVRHYTNDIVDMRIKGIID
jgi:hypothetical protein